MRRKLLAEALGTFTLVFTGAGAIVINDVSGGAVTHVGVAATFGLIVMAMIYALGEISGAHLNPAVTIGFWVARRAPGSLVGPYILAQLVGALLASLLLRVLFTAHPTLGATLPVGPWHVSFILEVVLTAILMFTILCVATGSKEQGLMAGIAIGAVVGLEAMFAGPICGASMNPARSLGPAIASGRLAEVWIYIAAPILGALVGVVCWRGIKSPGQAAVGRTAERMVETSTLEGPSLGR